MWAARVVARVRSSAPGRQVATSISGWSASRSSTTWRSSTEAASAQWRFSTVSTSGPCRSRRSIRRRIARKIWRLSCSGSTWRKRSAASTPRTYPRSDAIVAVSSSFAAQRRQARGELLPRDLERIARAPRRRLPGRRRRRPRTAARRGRSRRRDARLTDASRRPASSVASHSWSRRDLPTPASPVRLTTCARPRSISSKAATIWPSSAVRPTMGRAEPQRLQAARRSAGSRAPPQPEARRAAGSCRFIAISPAGTRRKACSVSWWVDGLTKVSAAAAAVWSRDAVLTVSPVTA